MQDGDHARDLVRLLCAAQASRWLAAGCRWHDVVVPADGSILAAWRSLGFGCSAARGLRSTAAPVRATALPPDVDVRRGAIEDVEAITRLIVANAVYHAAPPIAAPLPPGSLEPFRQFAVELMADESNVWWLAERGGVLLAGLGFQPVTAEGTLTSPARTVYLSDAYTIPSARGAGLTSALLAHALRWAAATGYEHCAVSWDTPNLLSDRFWRGHGFVPSNYRLYRLVDERATWASASPTRPHDTSVAAPPYDEMSRTSTLHRHRKRIAIRLQSPAPRAAGCYHKPPVGAYAARDRAPVPPGGRS